MRVRYSHHSPSCAIPLFDFYFSWLDFTAELIAKVLYCSYEKINVRSTGGKSKVLGTILGITGTMLLSFLKGAKINIWKLPISLLHASHTTSHADSKTAWLGILSGMGSCLSFSTWLIIQVHFPKSSFVNYKRIIFKFYLTISLSKSPFAKPRFKKKNIKRRSSITVIIFSLNNFSSNNIG